MTERVLVTGAGSGLGLESALYLAEQGYEVFAGVLTPQQQAAVEEQAAARALSLHTLLLDVTDSRCVDAVLAPVLAQGGLHSVIHSAGISLRGYFEDCDDDEIRQVLDVNLFGVMNVTRSVLPHMRQARRGHLIFISSIGGRIASMARTAYCASKFALEGFAESLMQEVMPFGVRVSIIEPAIIKTERWTVHRGLARRASAVASPYAQWFQREEELADALVASSPTKAQDVAAQIHAALISPQPKLRYVVGKRAALVLRLRKFFPGELFEQIYFGEAMRRVTSPPTPHSSGKPPDDPPNAPPNAPGDAPANDSSSHSSASASRSLASRPDVPRAGGIQRLTQMAGRIAALGVPTVLRMMQARRLNQETIRGYYITRVIITLINVGLFTELAREGTVNLAKFAEQHELRLKPLQTMADYLYIQRYFDHSNGVYSLTANGRLVCDALNGAFHIVHAYEDLTYNMEAMVRGEKTYKVDLFRRAEAMDRGSGLVGEAFAFPVMSEQIARRGFQSVLDIGCGDASFLTHLCRRHPNIKGYGLDIEPKGIALAQKRLEQEALQGRITLMVGDLYHLGLYSSGVGSLAPNPLEAVTMIYVLHELQDAIVPTLRKLKDALPNAWLLTCEVIRHTPEVLRQKPGGVSEIQLFHELSNQRLFTREEWHQMFRQAGAVEVQEDYLPFARTAVFAVRW